MSFLPGSLLRRTSIAATAKRVQVYPSLSYLSTGVPLHVRSLATTSASIPGNTAESASGGIRREKGAGDGGTAIVLLNMGGPSTVPEVYDFLSRLFVCSTFTPFTFFQICSPILLGRRRLDPFRPFPEIPRPLHRSPAHSQNLSSILRDWWGFPDP